MFSALGHFEVLGQLDFWSLDILGRSAAVRCKVVLASSISSTPTRLDSVYPELRSIAVLSLPTLSFARERDE